MRQKLTYLFAGVGPAECAVAGGETREGSEMQKMSDLGTKLLEGVLQVIICQLLDFSPARSSLPFGQGGGSLRAFRRDCVEFAE